MTQRTEIALDYQELKRESYAKHNSNMHRSFAAAVMYGVLLAGLAFILLVYSMPVWALAGLIIGGVFCTLQTIGAIYHTGCQSVMKSAELKYWEKEGELQRLNVEYQKVRGSFTKHREKSTDQYLRLCEDYIALHTLVLDKSPDLIAEFGKQKAKQYSSPAE